MKTSEIITRAKEYTWDYEYVGIRTQEAPFELGNTDYCSTVWSDNCPTDEKLDGISVTNINNENAVRQHATDHNGSYYYGEYKAIICAQEAEYGEDDGELILINAVVVEILC